MAVVSVRKFAQQQTCFESRRRTRGVIVCCSLSIATVFRSRRLLQRVMSMGSFCVQDVHICSFTWKIMRNICASAPTAPAAP